MLKEKIQQLKENMTKSDNKTGKKKVENLVVVFFSFNIHTTSLLSIYMNFFFFYFVFFC